MKLDSSQNATHLIRKMSKKTKTHQIKARKYLNLIILLIISLLIIGAANSMPEIHLMDQTDPLEYGGIQTVNLNITSNTIITQALIEFNGQNHTLEKQGGHYAYSWLPAHKGVNTYKIYVADALNETHRKCGRNRYWEGKSFGIDCRTVCDRDL